MPDAGKQPANFAVLTMGQADFQKRAVPFDSRPADPIDVKPPLLEKDPPLERLEGL